jgi:3-oxoacyl-[acyl-carrier-protein] synthase II
MALEHGGFKTHGQDKRLGVIVGTAMAEGLETEGLWEASQNSDKPEHETLNDGLGLRFPRINDTVASALGLKGPSHLLATTCAAGNHAISWASDLIKAGEAQTMLAVGADTIGYVDLLGFSRLLLQAPDCCRPFDLHRKGTILSEGAGAILLEPLTQAKRRGAEILAEVAGCGLSCDAAGPFASKVTDNHSLRIAAKRAFEEARCSPDEIEYISAHGSGTKLNDLKETNFIKEILGDHAYKVPTSSIKSMMGHAQGAASTLEAIASVLSFKHGVLYPTTNYETPDPLCDLDYVPNEARDSHVDTIMSSAFGIGGNNAIVIFKKWKGS